MDPDKRPTCEQLLQLPYFAGAATWFTSEFYSHQVCSPKGTTIISSLWLNAALRMFTCYQVVSTCTGARPETHRLSSLNKLWPVLWYKLRVLIPKVDAVPRPYHCMSLQATSRATLDALVTAGRVCRAARLKGSLHVPGWGGDSVADLDATAREISSTGDAAAATDFDSAAAAMAAADVFGAHFEDTATPSIAAEPQQWAHAAASAEVASAATCCRLPSAPAQHNDDECMSPAKPAVVGDAAGQVLQQQEFTCYQSAPPPPLAALPQPEGHNWSVPVNCTQGLEMLPPAGHVIIRNMSPLDPNLPSHTAHLEWQAANMADMMCCCCRSPVPLRSAQSASTAIDIVAAAAPYQAAEMPTLQHTARGSSRGNSSYHRLSRAVYAGNADATTMTKVEATAGSSQHGPCGSSDVSCSTAGGANTGFAAAAAAAAAPRPSDSSCGRPATPCSPFLPPPLGIVGTATGLPPHEGNTVSQGADTAGVPPLPLSVTVGAGEKTGSRKSRKRKGAALSRRQRRAAQRVTTAAGQLRLKR